MIKSKGFIQDCLLFQSDSDLHKSIGIIIWVNIILLTLILS
jgi:hypothetical protein